ncbi:MAG TPA: hypothetical protein VM124_02875 [Candidatus Limnocylindrales bacterium]|nr:hypothetical protein [Candidatus Limnocylindrales bacterium]
MVSNAEWGARFAPTVRRTGVAMVEGGASLLAIVLADHVLDGPMTVSLERARIESSARSRVNLADHLLEKRLNLTDISDAPRSASLWDNANNLLATAAEQRATKPPELFSYAPQVELAGGVLVGSLVLAGVVHYARKFATNSSHAT